MKITFNPMIQNASGAMGDMVFYDLDGQPVARKKGEPSKKPPTAAQVAHKVLVTRAAAWSKLTMTEPKQKAEYAAACRGHQTPYNLGFRDFLTPPVIESVVLDGYTGQIGACVRIKAWDDFEVTSVDVAIRDAENNPIEEGSATRGSKANEWNYLTKTEVAKGTSVLVEVTAMDRPKNKTQARHWHYLSAAPAASPAG